MFQQTGPSSYLDGEESKGMGKIGVNYSAISCQKNTAFLPHILSSGLLFYLNLKVSSSLILFNFVNFC